MFTILLVFLVVVVWVFSSLARAAGKIVESVGDPRDRVCKLNGQYHQLSLDSKKAVAKLYARGHRAIQERRVS